MANKVEKVEKVKSILKEFNIENPKINDGFWEIPDEYLPGPNANKEWACLLAAWKKNATLEELSNYSIQNAKTFQNLRDKGYLMVKTGPNYTCESENGTCRRINDWKIPKVDLPNIYVKLNTSDKKKYLLNKRDPYTMSRKNLQIDHRTPRKASKEKFSIEPAILTIDLIKSGKDKELFQVISTEINARKREICEKCLSGKSILLPEAVIDKDKYKRKFDNFCYLTKSCVGCYWYDPTITQIDVEKEYANKLNKATPEQLKKLSEHFNGNR